MKGTQAERDLCTWLWDKNYATLRAPASGSIDRPSPDVIAINQDEAYAVELKANKDGAAHFDEHEIRELEQWADRAGGTAYIVIKPDLRTFESWLVYHTSQLNETGNGFSIGKKDHERGKTRTEVFE